MKEGRRWRREEGRDGRRLISEQLMSSCVHHTHLLFSEVDVGQSEVDCVQVGGTGDIVHCSLITGRGRREDVTTNFILQATGLGMRLSHRYVVAMATQWYLDVQCSGLFEALLCLVILFSVYVQSTLGHVVEGGGATLRVCQLMSQRHLCKLCVCV